MSAVSRSASLLCTFAVLFSTAISAQTVNGAGGVANSIDGINVNGQIYNLTSFDASLGGTGSQFIFTDELDALIASDEANAALNSGPWTDVNSTLAGGSRYSVTFQGGTTDDCIVSLSPATSVGGEWEIDDFILTCVFATSALWELVDGAPTADAGGPYSSISYQTVNFDGSGSSDDVGAITNYAWDFGDGTTVSGASATAAHVYNAPGNYTVTLTVTDDEGLIAIDTAAVSIGGPGNTHVQTDTAGAATGILNINLNGTLYNVTSFDGSGAGDAFIFADRLTAEAAATLANAALNAAGITLVAQTTPVAGTSYCVGYQPGTTSDAAISLLQLSSWQQDPAQDANCAANGLAMFATWELADTTIPVVVTNESGLATAVYNLSIGAEVYNVTSFDGSGAGETAGFADRATAQLAAAALNTELTLAGIAELQQAPLAGTSYCVGYQPGMISDAAISIYSATTWQLFPALDFSCVTGGSGLFPTWQLVLGEIEADVTSGVLHPHHDGGPGAINGLNDAIVMTVYGASVASGDDFDFEADMLDPASLQFGPAGGAVDPLSTPIYADEDSDGNMDASFQFLTGDAGLGCSASDVTMSGISFEVGQVTITDDAVITDCGALCHN